MLAQVAQVRHLLLLAQALLTQAAVVGLAAIQVALVALAAAVRVLPQELAQQGLQTQAAVAAVVGLVETVVQACLLFPLPHQIIQVQPQARQQSPLAAQIRF
jgi:hypothetical protein